MKTQLIVVPYDTAQWKRRMGQGPEHLLNGGLIERLAAEGHDVAQTMIDPRPDFPAEIATGFALMSLIAEAVRGAIREGRFPLVLGGNCGQTIGAIAGLSALEPSLIWFDAHGDYHTPETTDSGFLDGMGLSIAAGHCWRRLTQSIPGFRPMPERNILLIGARDLDPPENARLSASTIQQLPDPGALRNDTEFCALVDQIRRDEGGIHLHVDLDVLDPATWQANQFPAAGGLTPARLVELIGLIAGRVQIAAAYVGSYDPAVDPNGRTRAAAFDVISGILEAAGRQQRAQ